jgi:hypothetical protein
MQKLITFLAILVSSMSLFAQSTEEYVLDSRNPNPTFSKQTEVGAKYLITVQGKYHQWPVTQSDCFGVDAVWYNDIPSFSNPIGDEIIHQLLKDPLWLGDSTIITLPSTGSIGSIKIGLRQYTGFRFNDKPLDKYPLDAINHRYQFAAMGNGQPFKFQILDSVFNIQEEMVIPRYDDNNGFLTVTIEKITDTLVKICDAEIITNENGSTQIRVGATILVKDSTSSTGTKRILADLSQIGIVLDGRFVCPDSLSCEYEQVIPKAVGLVIDRSASMEEPISQYDLLTTRMDAAKFAIKNFINNLNVNSSVKDSAFVLSFSNDFRLEHDWSSDKSSLSKSIDGIQPDSATALYAALLEALEKVKNHSNPGKAVILLTDGDNTRGPIWSEECIARVKKDYSNIPIYIITLSFVGSPREIRTLDTMRAILNSTVKGNVISVKEQDSLNKIYDELSKKISDDDCCSIFFKGTYCNDENEVKTVKIIFSIDSNLIVKEIKLKCKKAGSATSIQEGCNCHKTESKIKNVVPNPANNSTSIVFETSEYGNIAIEIHSCFGDLIKVYPNVYEPGLHYFNLQTSDFTSGCYYAIIKTETEIISKKFFVVH